VSKLLLTVIQEYLKGNITTHHDVIDTVEE